MNKGSNPSNQIEPVPTGFSPSDLDDLKALWQSLRPMSRMILRCHLLAMEEEINNAN